MDKTKNLDYDGFTSVCRKLAETNDNESILSLVRLYINSNQTHLKIVWKYLLSIDKKDELAQILLKQLKNKDFSDSQYLRIINLGLFTDREPFLMKLFEYAYRRQRSAQVCKLLNKAPLNETEQDILLTFLEKHGLYRHKWVYYLDEKRKSKLSETAFHSCDIFSFKSDDLKNFQWNKNIYDYIQADIRERIWETGSYEYACYLDFGDPDNREMLSLFSLPELFYIFIHSVYDYKYVLFEEYDVSVIAKMAKINDLLTDEEIEYVEKKLIELIRSGDKISYYLLFRFLSFFVALDYKFVESLLIDFQDEQFEEQLSNRAFTTLLRMRSKYAYDTALFRMLNKPDEKEFYHLSTALFYYYQEQREELRRIAEELFEDDLIATYDKIIKYEDSRVKDKSLAPLSQEGDKEKKNKLPNLPEYYCPIHGRRLSLKKTVKGTVKKVRIDIPILCCTLCRRMYTIVPGLEDLHFIRISSKSYINLSERHQYDSVIMQKDAGIRINWLEPEIDALDKKYTMTVPCFIVKDKELPHECKKRKCNKERLVKRRMPDIKSSHFRNKALMTFCWKCGTFYMHADDYMDSKELFYIVNRESVKDHLEEVEKRREIEKQKRLRQKQDREYQEVKSRFQEREYIRQDEERLKNQIALHKVIMHDTDKDETDIGIHDYVVRRNTFKCVYNNHILRNIDAVVAVIRKDGVISRITVSAGYCENCRVYFIMESTFQKLKNYGTPICRVSDEKAYLHNSTSGNNMNLAQESPLMQFGYNVSQTEGLTEVARQAILSLLVDNGVMTRSDIIGYLDFFIRQRRHMKNMQKAIEKWEADRRFISNYKTGNYARSYIGSIFHKSYIKN